MNAMESGSRTGENGGGGVCVGGQQVMAMALVGVGYAVEVNSRRASYCIQKYFFLLFSIASGREYVFFRLIVLP